MPGFNIAAVRAQNGLTMPGAQTALPQNTDGSQYFSGGQAVPINPDAYASSFGPDNQNQTPFLHPETRQWVAYDQLPTGPDGKKQAWSDVQGNPLTIRNGEVTSVFRPEQSSWVQWRDSAVPVIAAAAPLAAAYAFPAAAATGASTAGATGGIASTEAAAALGGAQTAAGTSGAAGGLSSLEAAGATMADLAPGTGGISGLDAAGATMADLAPGTAGAAGAVSSAAPGASVLTAQQVAALSAQTGISAGQIMSFLASPAGSKLLGSGLGLLAGAASAATNKPGAGGAQGFQGPIPQFTLNRQYNPRNEPGRRPGSGGAHKYFTDTWTQKLAGGGIAALKKEGRVDQIPNATDADYEGDRVNKRMFNELFYLGQRLVPGSTEIRGLPYRYDTLAADVVAQPISKLNVAGLMPTSEGARKNIVYIDPNGPHPASVYTHELSHMLDRNAGMHIGDNWRKQFDENAKALGMDPDKAYTALQTKMLNKVDELEGEYAPLRRRAYADVQHGLVYMDGNAADGKDIPKTLGLTPAETKLYNAMTGFRRTRLDARDLPPYKVDTANPANAPKKKNWFGFARGGIADLQPRMINGPGDGMSDSVPANIDGKQQAALADGEFVIPADVVSHLGNGSSDAGARRLYAMMDRIRHARTGSADQAPAVNAKKYLPT